MATVKVCFGPLAFQEESIICRPLLIAGPPRLGIPEAAGSGLDAGTFCKRTILGELLMRVARMLAAAATII